MARKKKPMISIVLCCYNGADVLPDALKAITNQKWDGKLDIIVVDDCSTDDTYKIAKSFKKVRVIHNEQNMGAGASRTIGIQAAKGEIIAFTDDDCRPKPTWIKELYAGYADENVQGVGGPIESKDTSNIVFRYLQANNPLRPLENSLAVSRNLLYRFALYFKALTGSTPKPKNRKRSVFSLVGANMSFRKSALDEVGGLDGRFHGGVGGEEEDLCKRINALHPGSLHFMPKAKVVHQFEPTLRDTLRRSQAYGKGNARMFHKHADVTPVVYPFPPLLILSLLLGFIQPWLLLLPVVAVPLLYMRWVRLAIARRRPEPLVYAYIQCLQEWYSNVGFVKGWWKFRHTFEEPKKPLKSKTTRAPKKAPVAEKPPRRLTFSKPRLIMVLAGTVIIANLLALTHGPVQAVLLLVFLCGMPGALLMLGLGVSLGRLHGILYALATSVALLIGVALLANSMVVLWPHHLVFGAPLLMAIVDALCVGLLALIWKRAQAAFVIEVPHHMARTIATGISMMAAPAAAFFAANFLNNTGINTLSMGVLALAAVVAITAGIFLKKMRAPLVPLLLYMLSVALIFLGAARGDFVSGTDISKEFYLLTLTQNTGHWSPNLYHDAYNACLSINLLPMLLGKITHVSDQTLFRFVLPAIYASLPVMVYALCRSRARQLTAYMAALFFIAQPVFITWSSIPIRQMMGFVFFGAMLLVAFDKALARWPRALLFTLFSFAMILSHYSTAYIAIGLLVLTYILQFVEYVATKRRLPWDGESFQPIAAAPLIVLSIAFAALWYGPITHTSTNITHLFSNGIREIKNGQINLFSSDAHSQQTGLLDQFNITSKPRSTQQVWQEYIQKTDQKYVGMPIKPMQSEMQTRAIMPLNSPVLPTHVGGLLGKATSMFGQVISKLTRLFLLIGLIIYVVRTRLRRAREERGFHLAAIAAAAIIVLIIVVPYASIDYDLGRTSQQLLILLALPAITGALWLVKTVSRARLSKAWTAAIVGSIIACYFLFMSGFVGQLTGGVAPLAMLNNSGNQYQIYVHSGELLAASWLDQTSDGKSLIYAGYFSGNRLWLANIDKPGFYNDILPWTIDKHAYVYAGYSETTNNVATTYYRGAFINYPYPSTVLNAHKDVLYTNGQATIYK